MISQIWPIFIDNTCKSNIEQCSDVDLLSIQRWLPSCQILGSKCPQIWTWVAWIGQWPPLSKTWAAADCTVWAPSLYILSELSTRKKEERKFN